jgi:hypothetical protein
MLLKKPNTNIFLATESVNDIVRMKGLGWVEAEPQAKGAREESGPPVVKAVEEKEAPKPAKKAAKAKDGE